MGYLWGGAGRETPTERGKMEPLEGMSDTGPPTSPGPGVMGLECWRRGRRGTKKVYKTGEGDPERKIITSQEAASQYE